MKVVYNVWYAVAGESGGSSYARHLSGVGSLWYVGSPLTVVASTPQADNA